MGASGSSPRVRGRLVSRPPKPLRLRLIPASAGQTLRQYFQERDSGAHPRECGADQSPSRCRLARRGSSPRVRGRRGHGKWKEPMMGLIPASAGQTPDYPHEWRTTGAHPRECGADGFVDFGESGAQGSSPRVRGRLLMSASVRDLHWAHPRECGADASGSARREAQPGSSPRVRGRLSCPGRGVG